MREHHDILLIEDDNDVREMVSEGLREEGYAVAAAANGAEALEALREGLDPSLILLDLMMPVMNGWEFRERQQEDPELNAIPVVVMSAFPGVPDPENLGSTGYLPKPFELKTLLATVERYRGSTKATGS